MSKTIIVALTIVLSTRIIAGAPEPNDTREQAEGTYVVAVDPDMLAKAVFPDCTRVPEPITCAYAGMLWTYQRETTGDPIQLVVGIYQNDRQAVRAWSVGMPQMTRPKARVGIGDQHYFAGRAYHVRLRNLVVLFIVDRRLSDDAWASIAERLADALRNPTIVRMGSSVNTPKLNVIDVTRVETYADGRKTPDRGYNIILTVEGAEEVLFLSNPNHRARKIGDAHYYYSAG